MPARPLNILVIIPRGIGSLALHDDYAVPSVDVIGLNVRALVVDRDQLRGHTVLADELVGHVAGTLLRELHVVVRGTGLYVSIAGHGDRGVVSLYVLSGVEEVDLLILVDLRAVDTEVNDILIVLSNNSGLYLGALRAAYGTLAELSILAAEVVELALETVDEIPVHGLYAVELYVTYVEGKTATDAGDDVTVIKARYKSSLRSDGQSNARGEVDIEVNTEICRDSVIDLAEEGILSTVHLCILEDSLEVLIRLILILAHDVRAEVTYTEVGNYVEYTIGIVGSKVIGDVEEEVKVGIDGAKLDGLSSTEGLDIVVVDSQTGTEVGVVPLTYSDAGAPAELVAKGSVFLSLCDSSIIPVGVEGDVDTTESLDKPVAAGGLKSHLIGGGLSEVLLVGLYLLRIS